MKRVILPLWISSDPQFCHIKCTLKHLALLPPWLDITPFLCLNIFLAGSHLPGAFPSLSCVFDLFSGFILSSFLLKGLPLSRNICITNLSQVFLLLPISTASDPLPYHFSLLIHIFIQYRTQRSLPETCPDCARPTGRNIPSSEALTIEMAKTDRHLGCRGTDRHACTPHLDRASSLPLTVVSPACHIVVRYDMNNISCFTSKHQEAGRVLSLSWPTLQYSPPGLELGQVLLHGSSIPAWARCNLFRFQK